MYYLPTQFRHYLHNYTTVNNCNEETGAGPATTKTMNTIIISLNKHHLNANRSQGHVQQYRKNLYTFVTHIQQNSTFCTLTRISDCQAITHVKIYYFTNNLHHNSHSFSYHIGQNNSRNSLTRFS